MPQISTFIQTLSFTFLFCCSIYLYFISYRSYHCPQTLHRVHRNVETRNEGEEKEEEEKEEEEEEKEE